MTWYTTIQSKYLHHSSIDFLSKIIPKVIAAVYTTSRHSLIRPLLDSINLIAKDWFETNANLLSKSAILS